MESYDCQKMNGQMSVFGIYDREGDALKVGQPGFPYLNPILMLTFRKGFLLDGRLLCGVRSYSTMSILIRTSCQTLAVFSPPLGPALFLSQICTGGNVHQSTGMRPQKTVNEDKSHKSGVSFIQISVWVILFSLGYRFVTQQPAFVYFDDIIAPR